jgi:hypothetical protein
MNITGIKNQIDAIRTLDIKQKIISSHPEQKADKIMIGELKLPQFTHLFDRMLLQLESFIKYEDAEYISEYLVIQELDTTNNSVTNYLNHIIDHVNHNDWPQVHRGLKWLISFEAFYGFWTKSKDRIHDVETIKLKETAEEIEVVKIAVQQIMNKLEEKSSMLDAKAGELQNFILTKQQELDIINSKRDEINNKTTEANQLLITINDYKSQSENSKNLANEHKEEVKRILEEEKDVVTKFNAQANSLTAAQQVSLTEVEMRLGKIDEDYEHIKSKREYIDLKELDIIKLATKAGDGALGHTFGTREGNLGSRVTLWMILTFVMIAILFTWIFIVFYYLNDSIYSPDWINPLISAIKTIPAFIILAFVARQYTKERNLQEEYAFKSAIAMTLTAYADEIAREEDEDRREIIKETINKVYKAPRISTEKMNFMGMSSKQKKEYFETLTNTLKDVVEKTNKKV